MFFLPTRQRAARLQETIDACVATGMTAPCLVMIDPDGAEAYGDIRWPENFRHMVRESGLTSAGTMRVAFRDHPDLAWYGVMSDDCPPVTKGWDQKLIDGLKAAKFVSANDGWQAREDRFQSRLSPVTVWSGDLLRTVGFWAPEGFSHYCVDDVWETIGRDFGIWTIDMDVLCEHRHAMNQKAPDDATYQSVYGAEAEPTRQADIAKFVAWKSSPERWAMNERIAASLGGHVMQFNPHEVNIGICIPCHDGRPENAFNMSLRKSETLLKQWNVPFGIHWTIGGSHIGKARERVLWNAYRQEPKHTHFLFIDTDMGWEPHLILRLLAARHDFAVAIGMRKEEKVTPACNFLPSGVTFHERSKFVRLRDAGFAFALITRECVDRLCAAYPELEYEAGNVREWALFLDIIDREYVEHGKPGDRLSEDYSFCRRWRRIGGEIFCDQDTALDHVGKKAYTGKPSDFFVFTQAKPPAPPKKERKPRKAKATNVVQMTAAAE